jgi:hypothetical protein
MESSNYWDDLPKDSPKPFGSKPEKAVPLARRMKEKPRLPAPKSESFVSFDIHFHEVHKIVSL